MTHTYPHHLCLALTLCASAAIAQSQPPTQTNLPLWEVGGVALAVSQPAYPGADQQGKGVVVLPYLVYRGPLLRADRGTVGLRVVKTPEMEVDVSASLTLGFNPSGVTARQGMPSVGTLFKVGPRASWNLGRYDGVRWSAQWPVYEVIELYAGAHARGIATEPELRFDARHSAKLNWGMSAGALVGDRSLNQLFYGVDSNYATASRPAYEAQAGLIAWRVGLFGNYQLSPDLRVFMQNRWDNLSGAANTSSPLVKSHQGFATTVGLVYIFDRSVQSVSSNGF